MALNEIVHQLEDVVVEVESLAAYPNGFVINLHIATNPRNAQQTHAIVMQPGGQRIPRVGVRFSDGRTAGQEAGAGPMLRAMGAMDKDAEGFPTVPVVRMTGGGGGGSGWRFGTWVYPLPPEGPLEIFISIPQAGLEEAKTVIEGADVLAAADRAKVIWE
jgi:hypothetical protein